MKLSMPRNGFMWGRSMALFDRPGHPRYIVSSEAYSLGKRLHVKDLAGREIISIHQKIPSLLPSYEIEINGRSLCTVVKDLTYIRPRYVIDSLDWHIAGSTSTYEYQIIRQDTVVASSRPIASATGDLIVYNFDDRDKMAATLGIMLTVNCILVQQESRHF